jgi:anti-sigma B factor antagonist
MTCEVRFEGGRLHLSGAMTIFAAAELKSRLVDELKKRRRKGSVDLSEVTELDTAGVQLLLMARRMCRKFSIINPSAAAQDALALCGLGNLIEVTPRSEP